MFISNETFQNVHFWMSPWYQRYDRHHWNTKTSPQIHRACENQRLRYTKPEMAVKVTNSKIMKKVVHNKSKRYLYTHKTIEMYHPMFDSLTTYQGQQEVCSCFWTTFSDPLQYWIPEKRNFSNHSQHWKLWFQTAIPRAPKESGCWSRSCYTLQTPRAG